jgi:hypothetical protein
MTKKFLIAFSDKGLRKTKKKEFLIPDFIHFSNYFIGIETFKPCQYGFVVYTGVELTAKVVIEKLQKNKLLEQPTAEIENLIIDYLQFIKNCKIADVVEISYDSGRFTYKVTGLRMNHDSKK